MPLKGSQFRANSRLKPTLAAWPFYLSASRIGLWQAPAPPSRPRNIGQALIDDCNPVTF